MACRSSPGAPVTIKASTLSNTGTKARSVKAAPVGWFRVTVIDSTIPVPPPGQEPRPSAVPLVYGLPSKTPLLQEVKAGDNTIDLDLKK